MKLLADQNVHRRVVLRLRQAGFEVEFIQETMPGRLDPEILARTDIGELVFITGDKGFGNWIFNLGLPAPLAILFSRLPQPAWAETSNRLIAILERGVPPGHMIVIAEGDERARPFPMGAKDA